MADPTKPSDQVTPAGGSPISPQIKIPSSSSAAASAPPPNLPTRPQGGSVPPPIPKPIPPTPPPSPAAPKPPVSAPPVTPPQKPAETSSNLPVFKSSIRTMQEDISALKKGQAPVGFQMEKQSEADAKTPPPPAAPKITPPPKPSAEIKLGEMQKAKPLEGAKVPTPPGQMKVPPPVPEVKPELAVPPSGGTNIKRLIMLVVGLVVVAFLVWFFVLRSPSEPEVAITPTPTDIVITPTPAPLEDSFPLSESVKVAPGANFTTRLGDEINKNVLVSTGGPGIFKILDPTSSERYTFKEFLAANSIIVPSGLTSVSGDLYMTVINKADGKLGYGMIVKLNDPTLALNAIAGWESTMTNDLKTFLAINPAKAASKTFLDNTYNGTAIRFRNFPDPNSTIDYTIVTAKNGQAFLVITNSREHMYSILDKIK